MAVEPEKKPRGLGRVAFLAHLEPITQMLNEGHQVSAIYTQFEDRLGISYAQFTRYVNKYLRKESQDEHQRKKQGPAQNPIRSGSTQVIAKPKKPVPFAHDPESGNTRDDLI